MSKCRPTVSQNDVITLFLVILNKYWRVPMSYQFWCRCNSVYTCAFIRNNAFFSSTLLLSTFCPQRQFTDGHRKWSMNSVILYHNFLQPFSFILQFVIGKNLFAVPNCNVPWILLTVVVICIKVWSLQSLSYRSSYPMGPVGMHPVQLWRTWWPTVFGPSKFCDCRLCLPRCVTSEELQLWH